MIFMEESIIYPQDLRDYRPLNLESKEFKVEIVYYYKSNCGQVCGQSKVIKSTNYRKTTI